MIVSSDSRGPKAITVSGTATNCWHALEPGSDNTSATASARACGTTAPHRIASARESGILFVVVIGLAASLGARTHPHPRTWYHPNVVPRDRPRPQAPRAPRAHRLFR